MCLNFLGQTIEKQVTAKNLETTQRQENEIVGENKENCTQCEVVLHIKKNKGWGTLRRCIYLSMTAETNKPKRNQERIIHTSGTTKNK
jgi:hypothetical protein